MELITKDDIKAARDKRRKYGRKSNTVTFPAELRDKARDVAEEADDDEVHHRIGKTKKR